MNNDDKPLIICLVGPSGSGKTTLAEYLDKKHDIPMIQSYTTRKPRYEGENGHQFISPLEFMTFSRDDMIAYTKFGDAEYCCLKKDVQPINTYVIDEVGLKYLKKTYKDDYNIFAVWINRSEAHRLDSGVSQERINRDKGMFSEDNRFLYDAFIMDSSLEMMFFQMDTILLKEDIISSITSPLDYIKNLPKEGLL